MLEEYPRKITLPDGLSLTLRPMTKDDQYGLYSFFVSLPEEDRRFLRNDVADRKLIEKWARNLDYDRVLPIVAEYEGRIVANATLHYQTFGWRRHVAEIQITITPEFQRRGLAAALLEEVTRLAAKSRVTKLLARIVTSREGVITSFERAGFKKLSVLRQYAKDLQQPRDADLALLVKELLPTTLYLTHLRQQEKNSNVITTG